MCTPSSSKVTASRAASIFHESTAARLGLEPSSSVKTSASLPNVLDDTAMRGKNGIKTWRQHKCFTINESSNVSVSSSGDNLGAAHQYSTRKPMLANRQGRKSKSFQNFGQFPSFRPTLAYEQLQELVRLCHHEYQTNESYHHAIRGLLYQIQEPCKPPGFGLPGDGNDGSGTWSGTPQGIPLCYTLPPTPINPELPYRACRRVEIPSNPNCNLIGRVLGPRGLTIRELESRFRCRIYVRGRGSVRDPERAKRLEHKPGWEHLSDNLHVLIIAGGNFEEKGAIECRLSEAESFVNRILHPHGFDAFKRRQLASLAVLNGTFRPPTHFAYVEANQIPCF